MIIDKTYKKIGIGVSGGVDSMVLLHKLLCAKFDVFVINVEHGIRGEHSISDSQFVENFCKENNVPFVMYHFDALSKATSEKISVELAARLGRYELFAKAISDYNLDAVALAHHLNDQTETVLMRIFRGTGIKGLKGIVDRGKFIHPLLDETRDEIVAYAAKNDIIHITDETNSQDDYTRNFIRNQLVTKIKEKYPHVEKAFLRLSETAKELDDYLDSVAYNAIERGNSHLLATELFSEHKVIIKKSIYNLFKKLNIFTDIETVNVNDIISLHSLQVGKQIDLPHNFVAQKTYDGILFFKKTTNVPFTEIPFVINKPFAYNGVTYNITKTDVLEKKITFDLAKIPQGSVIRTRQPNDMFCRYKGKNKKLSDYLTDEKVPLNTRDNLLLVANENTIYCILGYEIGDKIATNANTTQLFKCECTITY